MTTDAEPESYRVDQLSNRGRSVVPDGGQELDVSVELLVSLELDEVLNEPFSLFDELDSPVDRLPPFDDDPCPQNASTR